jgi:hypothetical protein
MKEVVSFIMNILGIILFGIVVVVLTQLFDYFAPKLIELGWPAYFISVILGEGLIIGLITLLQVVIGSPFYFLITAKFAKIICIIFSVFGFLYSISTPWQFANAIGFSFIVFIWCFTLTIMIFSAFFGLVLAALYSKNKSKTK